MALEKRYTDAIDLAVVRFRKGDRDDEVATFVKLVVLLADEPVIQLEVFNESILQDVKRYADQLNEAGEAVMAKHQIAGTTNPYWVIVFAPSSK